MDLKTKQLQRLKAEKTFVNILSDLYDGDDLGFIVDFDEQFLVLERFDYNYQPDGIVVMLIDNINRIRWGGNSLVNTVRLLDTQNRIKELPHIDLNSTETVLKSMQKAFGSFSVYPQTTMDNEAFFTVQIHEIDEDIAVLKELGTIDAPADRHFLMLPLEDITRVQGGGLYERNLERLQTPHFAPK